MKTLRRGVIMALLLTSPCLAQELAGPKVESAAAAPSLIQRDFAGTITRLDTLPEEAATKLLTLTPQEQAAIDLILAERAAIFDKAVGENYELVLRLQGFREAKLPERLAMLREWNAALRELKAHGKLIDELAAGLSKDNAAQFRRLVTDYREGIIAQTMKGNDATGEKPMARQQAQSREHLIELGQEIKRAFDRRIAEGKSNIEQLVKTIDATPEQREKLESISLDYAQKALGKPTKQQKAALIRSIFEVLTPEQRRTVVAEYLGKK
jgi:DNA-binding MarR family transcriptional regulator